MTTENRSVGFKMHPIPYYPELVGQPIPGTNRKTQNQHVLLFGLLNSLDNDSSGCYMSKRNLAMRLNTTPGNINNLRADLLKLGWISVIKNKNGEITNTYTVQAELIPVNQPQLNTLSATAERPYQPQLNGSTEVRPQSENNIENKVIKADFDKSACVCPNSLETSPKEDSSPFGDPLNKSSIGTDLRKSDDEQLRARRRAYAIANNVRKRLGLKGSASSQFKDGVKRWLDAGYTEDQIVEAQQMMEKSGNKYLEEANPLSRLAQANMDWYEQQKKNIQKQGQGDYNSDEGFLPITIPGRVY